MSSAASPIMVLSDGIDVMELTGEMIPKGSRRYRDGISITMAHRLPELRRYYKSTYNFCDSRRYKSVVHLAPTLAPVR